MSFLQRLTALSILAGLPRAVCIASGLANIKSAALQVGWSGTIVQLCPNAVFTISDTITFTSPDQELSIYGFPTDGNHAQTTITRRSSNTSAVWGKWTSGVHVLNIQMDGNRPNSGLFGGML